VCTEHPYIPAVFTARIYGCIFDTRTYGPYIWAVEQKPRPIIDTNILCGTGGDATQHNSLRAMGSICHRFFFCIKNTTYIASSLFRSRIGEMSVIENDAAYFPRCSDTQFCADNDRVEMLISLYHSNECLWNSRCFNYKKSQ